MGICVIRFIVSVFLSVKPRDIERRLMYFENRLLYLVYNIILIDMIMVIVL